MLKILLVGGPSFDSDQLYADEIEKFARLLAREVITQGHLLLINCWQEFDRIVAESANKAAEAFKLDPNDRIISYAPRGASKEEWKESWFGKVLESELEDW